MSARIEVPVLNAYTVERVFERALDRHRHNDVSFAAKGMRVAHANNRDTEVLKAVLERCAEVTDRQAEDQVGRYRRDPGTVWSHRTELNEPRMFRQCLETLDRGEPMEQWAYVYAAAAEAASIFTHGIGDQVFGAVLRPNEPNAVPCGMMSHTEE